MSPQERSRPNHIPSFSEANAAYDEIVEHNRCHTGMGAGIANLFKAMFEESEPIDPEDPSAGRSEEGLHSAISERFEQDVTEGDMHGELQSILHEDIFLRIGLKMEPFGAHVVNGEGERTTSTALVPMIENTELFKEFLTTINPEEVEVGEDQKLLSSVLGTLQQTVTTCFDPEERSRLPGEFQDAVDQYGEDALRTFIAVAPEYQRLGLDAESLRKKFATKPEGTGYIFLGKNATQEQRDQKAAHDTYNAAHHMANTFETMEEYVTFWGRSLLPEFIVASRGQYLKKPDKQGFGPAQWHYDGGQRYWRPALEFVAQLSQEERTKEFGEEVRQSLVHSLDTAIEEIDAGVRKDGGEVYFAGQRDDLINVRNVLTGQPFDAERLEEYTKAPKYGL